MLKDNRPLCGIRVVEAAGYHAAPGAGATLAELGAEVIKIENPQGDPERHQRRDGTDPIRTAMLDRDEWSVLYDLSNKGKRGICLDLKTHEAQAILSKMIETADVFLTNMPPSTRPRLGTDYERLSAVNPRLVYCSLTAFGPEGPMADQNGFDSLGQAMSGMMHVAGNLVPGPLGLILLDQAATIVATNAITTALLARELQGHGQDVHVSLLGAATWLMQTNLLASSVNGSDVDTSWNRLRNSPNSNVYQAGDGRWILVVKVPEETYFPTLCEVLGLPELPEDPRFSTREQRMQHRAEMYDAIDGTFKSRPAEEWLTALRDAGFLVAPVNNFLDVVNHPQVLANSYVVDFDHPVLGPVKVPQVPIRFGKSDQPKVSAAPQDIGQDTDDVLNELGFDDDTIRDLRSRAVVR
jgi:crotonobetainyl-CoA:carnitine CoA-transferase CaiB-like acyl-CoA transferase